MIVLGPAPLKNPMFSPGLSDSWAKWFRDIAALLSFNNNHSRTPAPAYTGVVDVGTVDKTLVYVKDRNLVQVQILFRPVAAGTFALTLGSSFLSNLPYAASHEAVGILVNLSTLAIVGAVHAAVGTTRLNLPALGATNAPHAGYITYRTEDA
jgi:hypothetical protein